MWYKILIIVLASLLIILLAFSIGLVFVFLGRPKEKIDLKSDINGENNKKGFFKNIEEVNAIEEVKNRFLALSPKELTLDCSDGKKRFGYFYRSKTSNVLVVFSHGWKSNGLVNFGITGEYALKNDYNILVVDHLGHGKSDGNLMGFGIKDYYALCEWCDYINNIENNTFDVFLHGVSMGSNIVMLCANKDIKGFRGIIADCGFTNAWSQFSYSFKKRFHLPAFPALSLAGLITKMFMKMDLKKYSTLDTLSNAKVPVYFIHGEYDDFVPTKMTYENVKVVSSKYKLWITSECTHAKSALIYRDEYMANVQEFIEENKSNK